MLSIYHEICKIINCGANIVLVTILNKNGTSPRDSGVKMIIKDDFSIIGTIGGGLFEAMTIKLSREVFESRAFVIKDFNHKNGNQLNSDMICGFDLEVLIEYIDASDENVLMHFNMVREYLDLSRNFIIVTKFIKYSTIRRDILFEEDYYKLDCIFREKFSASRFSKLKFLTIEEDDELIVICPMFNVESVFIFGAGHIGQKLSQITKMLNFNTVILDDREEFANRERFPEVDNIIVLESFRNVERYINIRENSYIIIVTRGHVDDMEVLGEVLRSNAKYIGMIGSKKKRDATYKELIKRGFKEEELKKVHSPIGIDIKADTPEEITVSIAAELVKVRKDIYE